MSERPSKDIARRLLAAKGSTVVVHDLTEDADGAPLGVTSTHAVLSARAESLGWTSDELHEGQDR